MSRGRKTVVTSDVVLGGSGVCSPLVTLSTIVCDSAPPVNIIFYIGKHFYANFNKCTQYNLISRVDGKNFVSYLKGC